MGIIASLLYVTSSKMSREWWHPPFFFSLRSFSENANKQRHITSFSLLWNNWDSLLINDDIHLFSAPSLLPSALSHFLSTHKGCPCVETMINLFPIPLPMTLFSALRFGKHWTLSRDGSEDIPKPPRAVYANPCRFDREEVSCGICGFCDGRNSQLSSLHLPLQYLCLSPLSYEKSDHSVQLKPRLSFWACVCWWYLLIVCVFRPGVEHWWGVTRACMYVEGVTTESERGGTRARRDRRVVNS